MENKSNLTNKDLVPLLEKLKSQTVDSTQALEILRLCSFGRTIHFQGNIVNGIWNELKKENKDFQVQHYNCMLHFGRNRGNFKLVQTIFDGMIEDGIKPNA